jgi:hypothetical protein
MGDALAINRLRLVGLIDVVGRKIANGASEKIDVAFSIRHGSGRLIMPAGESWDAFFAGPRLDQDFLADRAQPAPQRRETD